MTPYQQKIIDYYRATENAYKDSWDLENSLSIHYGYWDDKVNSFPQSLARMNEVMAEAATIRPGHKVLDAGCGIGGSSIFIASSIGARVTGITLSERQVKRATANAEAKGVDGLVKFRVMDYCRTEFPPESFDVVWGCESICYAEHKELFIGEAWRILKPGGCLVVADGFVNSFENNKHPLIRQWLDGWQVNYLESPDRFEEFLKKAGFIETNYKDISGQTLHSSRRLHRIYYLASLYLLWRKMTFTKPPTDIQKSNITACKYQYLARKQGLWEYGLVTARKSQNMDRD